MTISFPSIKIISNLCIILLISIDTKSQYFDITLEGTSNQVATSLVVTDQFVYTLSSSTVDTIGKTMLIITKTDKSGNIISNTAIEGAQNFSVQKAVMLGENFYCAGQYSFDNQVDFGLLKVSIDGTLQWERTYYASSLSESFLGITHDHQNHLILSGYYTDTLNQNSLSVHVMKVDTSGNEVWTYQTKSNLDEVAMNCAVYSNNDIALAFDRETNYGYTLVWQKLSQTGDLLNEITIKNNKNRGCKNVIVDENDNTYIVGESYTNSSPAFDITLTKIDALGALLFDYYLPGTNKGEAGFAVRKKNNHILITGYAYDPIEDDTKMGCYLFSNDTILNQWAFYGESGITFGYDLQWDSDGSFWACGAEYGDFGGLVLVKGNLISLDIQNQIFETKRTFNVFPNPASQGDVISLEANFETEFNLFDSNGKLISTHTDKIKSTNLKAGSYIISPSNNFNNTILSKTIIIQ